MAAFKHRADLYRVLLAAVTTLPKARTGTLAADLVGVAYAATMRANRLVLSR